ncbi:MAG: hypothetical protein U0232_05965 [Thermomicrobiales bacterium]
MWDSWTLTGPGGVGKTRLALAVAAALATPPTPGICQISLAPIRDPTLVPTAIAKGLGIEEIVGRSPREVLLDFAARSATAAGLLDNCEHLLESVAPLTGELLSACPRLTVLATSRAPLRLSGEFEYPVAPARPACARRRAGSRYGNPIRPWRALVQRGPGDPARLRPHFRQRGGAGDDLPSAGWPAAGDRTGRAAPAPADPPTLLDRLPPSRCSPAAPGINLTGAATLRATPGLEPRSARLSAGQALFGRLSVFSGGASLAAIEALRDEGNPLARAR